MRVSKKFRVVIPEKVRVDAQIKPGDVILATSKHGILQYVPVRRSDRPIEKTKGIIDGLDTQDLRDESDRA